MKEIFETTAKIVGIFNIEEKKTNQVIRNCNKNDGTEYISYLL